MRRLITLIAMTLSVGLVSAAQETVEETPAIQVMVLGSVHFAGGGADAINIQPADVLHPSKQAELEAATDALLAFDPTVIVTERVTEAPEYLDPVYRTFTPESLSQVRNERHQIAYRLAYKAEIDRVYGLDEQPSEGEPNYFPLEGIEKLLADTGRLDELSSMFAELESVVRNEMSRLDQLPISEALIEINTGLLSSAELYYEMLKLDDGERQPAAELNGYWMMRNAKIFSKLVDVTRPGDRVIIVYGAGHKHWLEHFVVNTPGFELIDPVGYLVNTEND